MVEHYVRDVGAAGSNPVTSTIFLKARWFLSACFFVYKRIFETRRGMKIMLVEKDVSERILSLYDAEDLELCEAYAVDAHLGENLPEFATVYRAEPEHFCFVINPDRIGRNYFKLYNHRFPEEATKMARICFFDAQLLQRGVAWQKDILDFESGREAAVAANLAASLRSREYRLEEAYRNILLGSRRRADSTRYTHTRLYKTGRITMPQANCGRAGSARRRGDC